MSKIGFEMSSALKSANLKILEDLQPVTNIKGSVM